MFSFNNNHIFTGYLKQLLATVNIPTYKIYTTDFTRHVNQTGREDPRVIESFGTLGVDRPIANVNYLKNNEVCTLRYDFENKTTAWKSIKRFNYDKDTWVAGATRKLKSLGPIYDTHTHEYLGDFLRFIRDYYNIDLMSLYNCFNNKIYSNIDFSLELGTKDKKTTSENFTDNFKKLANHLEVIFGTNCSLINLAAHILEVQLTFDEQDKRQVLIQYQPEQKDFRISIKNSLTKRPILDISRISGWDTLLTKLLAEGYIKDKESCQIISTKTIVFDSADPNFRIYAFPVKLFSKYTIALDSDKGLELFCGFYRNTLEGTTRCVDLFNKTYQKIDKAMFNQPFIYDKLSSDYWTLDRELSLLVKSEGKDPIPLIKDPDSISRCDLISREQDLKLFIKIPANCKSTITVLEGDFTTYNDCKYIPKIESGRLTKWNYSTNHSVVNFDNRKDLNSSGFKPISKIQLLAFNTGESYPFADRLVEYLSGSAITPVDGIADNIKRVQKVMAQNNHYFRTEGIWENQIQKIAYDYIMNAGPIEYNPETGKLNDKRLGLHPRAGHSKKCQLYDILGFIDRDVEKYYANWKVENERATIRNNIHNVDIYDGLYDI